MKRLGRGCGEWGCFSNFFHDWMMIKLRKKKRWGVERREKKEGVVELRLDYKVPYLKSTFGSTFSPQTRYFFFTTSIESQ